MKWPLLLVSIIPGGLFGAVTVFAVIHGREHTIGVIVLASLGIASVFLAPMAPARHAFAAGFLAALTAILVQILFFDVYFQNNPEYAAISIPFGLSAMNWTILMAPLGAFVAGCLSLFAALLVRMIFVLANGNNNWNG